MRKTLIYTRVSTDDQNNDRQISDLTNKASHYGMDIVATFSDKISGSKGFTSRSGGGALMQFIEDNGGITDIAVSEVSRISRDVEDTKRVIRILSERGINIFIANTAMNTLNMDGTKNPMVSFMITILAGAAEYEKELLIERTKSGMAYAKSQGAVFGKKKHPETERVMELFRAGRKASDIMKETGVAKSIVYRIKKQM